MNTMNCVYWEADFISAFLNVPCVEAHSHWMQQLFICQDSDFTIKTSKGEVSGQCIIVDANIHHFFSDHRTSFYTMLIDPTSNIANCFRKHYINPETGYGILDISTLINGDINIQTLSTRMVPEEYKVFRDELLNLIGVNQYKDLAYDDRVATVIRLLDEYDFYDLRITELAAKIGLSESRLAHLFKAETGIPLKGYFVMKKWKKAYEILLQSKNITKAAIDAGFFGSSHFSAANKKITGMPAQKILSSSEFLKVY